MFSCQHLCAVIKLLQFRQLYFVHFDQVLVFVPKKLSVDPFHATAVNVQDAAPIQHAAPISSGFIMGSQVSQKNCPRRCSIEQIQHNIMLMLHFAISVENISMGFSELKVVVTRLRHRGGWQNARDVVSHNRGRAVWRLRGERLHLATCIAHITNTRNHNYFNVQLFVLWQCGLNII